MNGIIVTLTIKCVTDVFRWLCLCFCLLMFLLCELYFVDFQVGGCGGVHVGICFYIVVDIVALVHLCMVMRL